MSTYLNKQFAFDLLNKKLQKPQATVKLMVLGNSMHPKIMNNDYVIIEKSSSYSIGDVLVFLRDNNFLVHRYLKYKDNKFLCKGDNSFMIEDVAFDNIIGKVKAIIRNDILIEVESVSADFINLSFEIGLLFESEGYKKEIVRQTENYRQFYMKYLC